MIGGSVKVLVYVLAAAFIRCRLDLLTVETSDQVILCPLLPQSELSSQFVHHQILHITQVIQVLQGMKEERQEAALTSGLDLWEMDGCPLLLGEVHG